MWPVPGPPIVGEAVVHEVIDAVLVLGEGHLRCPFVHCRIRTPSFEDASGLWRWWRWGCFVLGPVPVGEEVVRLSESAVFLLALGSVCPD